MSEEHAAVGGVAVGSVSPDPGNPGQLVADSVEACLEIAATWHAWDGRPVARTVDGKPNTWTPAKALRRITDHLIDHLAQVEVLLAGVPSIPDAWHGRSATLPDSPGSPEPGFLGSPGCPAPVCRPPRIA